MTEIDSVAQKKTFPYRIQIEPRLNEPPALVSSCCFAWRDCRGLDLGRHRDCHSPAAIPCAPMRILPRLPLASLGVLLRYHRQGHADHSGRPGLFDRLPHEVVEHWRRRTVHHGRIWRQRGRAGSRSARRDSPLDVHPGDDAGRHGWRAPCGDLFPGILKAKFNVNEIISTLMLNYIAVAWNNFWIFARLDRRRLPDVAEVPEDRLAAAPV